MGCFLACFGFSKKRKRRRPANRVSIDDQFHGSYKQLLTSPNADNFIFENPVAEDFRDEPKKQPRQKIRKKVTFNLNVQTYEPIPDEYFVSDTEKEVKETTSQDVCSLSLPLYPSNHRYRNCSYEEEDVDTSLEESVSDQEDDNQADDSDEEPFCQAEFAGPSRSQCEHSVLKPIENLTQWKTAKANAKAWKIQ